MTSANARHEEYVYLCGTRDYHAMDWYRLTKDMEGAPPTSLVTDSRGGEGFKDLARDTDVVHELIVIDALLFRQQNRIGDLWRNILKLLLMPIQILLLRRFARRHPRALYFPHSMYYLWLAWGAGVEFVGLPQGSDLLVKPWRSRLFRFFSVRALRGAKAVWVDSLAMQDAANRLAGVHAFVIRNGINLDAIRTVLSDESATPSERSLIVSARGITPLYRIEEIIRARNCAARSDAALDFVYPFADRIYRDQCFSLLRPNDKDHGRIERDQMYRLFTKSRLVLSIPTSDSSPKTIYEALYCGAPVAMAYNPFYEDLPSQMRSRIIIVDPDKGDWFDEALERAKRIGSTPPRFKTETWDWFDSKKSIKDVIRIANDA